MILEKKIVASREAAIVEKKIVASHEAAIAEKKSPVLARWHKASEMVRGVPVKVRERGVKGQNNPETKASERRESGGCHQLNLF